LKPTPATRALSQAITDATRADYEIMSTAPVAGGCIHTALRVSGEDSDGKKSYFAKLNEPNRAPMFAAEAEGLVALAGAKALHVPAVVTHGHDDEFAWLVLEWLDLSVLDARSAARLGEALAIQHRIAQATFGWGRDNFIGASPQVNGAADDWVEFWRTRRLHAQLRLAAHNRLPSKMIDRGERLMTDCDAFFTTYTPEKSLLHGDLWGGNAAALADGTPVVFDPAVYVGDREADVAMTGLFGGFPAEFMAAYRARWPLDDGYRVRKELYNLYHRLNHANLFKGSHVRESERAIERLLAEIR
jgi:protein-ribulosamine 3-kinase